MNQQFKKLNNIVGWAVFAIAAMVYALTAEPTTSLWDCGEFISASHKLQVVHPPGAPLFLMINRMFAVVAETFTSNPENIAYAVNLSSGVCTAFLVLFIFWSTTILAKLSLVGREGEIENVGQMWAILGAGIVAGLSTTFATSVWFSAVEGEVYAMSSMFTGLVAWAGLRWYVTDGAKADRWLVFIAYMIGLSIGVHLLSILVVPFVALLYYYKKFNAADEARLGVLRIVVLAGVAVGVLVLASILAFMVLPENAPRLLVRSLVGLASAAVMALLYRVYKNNDADSFPVAGTVVAGGVGFVILLFLQYFVIPQVPAMAAAFDYGFVNNMGTSVGTGMLFFVLLLSGIMAGLVWMATKYKSYYGQMALTSLAMVLLGFSTYVMIVIRANTHVPINMNAPADPYSLLSYLNREQYGDRPLGRGPHYFSAVKRDGNGQPVTEPGRKVFRPVTEGGVTRYELVQTRSEYVYEERDLMYFPRLGHLDRAPQYQRWLGHYDAMEDEYMACQTRNGVNSPACEALNPDNPKAYQAWAKKRNLPNFSENLRFFFSYQINWMYMRYFMWNFVGRQNALQGMDGSGDRGNWISGISFIDEMYTHTNSNLPASMRNDKGRNTYYFLPLIFGLLGMFFHFGQRPKEAFAVLSLFILTGVAIIVFLNQPPSEPRERDYAFAGSIFTFCIWIGMSVPLLYSTLVHKLQNPVGTAALAILFTSTAPLLMCSQNWDDHSRAGHYGARDYASNFLNSCAPNAILFTYGDNDTYPLWYAQEVEGIRRDVRVVNFSLLAVDWYINQLRFKINESPAIKMSMNPNAYRASRRDYLPIELKGAPMAYDAVLKTMINANPKYRGIESFIPTAQIVVPVDLAAVRKNNALPKSIADSLVPPQLLFDARTEMWTKDDIALYDIIATNIQNGWERPIYFAVTCRPDKLDPYRNYLQLEGMALRLVPFGTAAPDNAQAAMQLGRTEIDTMYRNIMERYKWGNFDTHETFIDESYRPSVQSIQYSMMRLTDELLRIGDKARAANVCEKLFSAFPHYNFPLDENRVAPQMLMYYYRTDAKDKADAILETMANELLEKRRFYMSLDRVADQKLFAGDANYNGYLLELLHALAGESNNSTLKTRLQKEIEAAGIKPRPILPPPTNTPQPTPADSTKDTATQ